MMPVGERAKACRCKETELSRRLFCRLVEIEGMDGMMRQEVRPYLLDLGSTNGTFINNERIEAERFHELREQACF